MVIFVADRKATLQYIKITLSDNGDASTIGDWKIGLFEDMGLTKSFCLTNILHQGNEDWVRGQTQRWTGDVLGGCQNFFLNKSNVPEKITFQIKRDGFWRADQMEVSGKTSPIIAVYS